MKKDLKTQRGEKRVPRQLQNPDFRFVEGYPGDSVDRNLSQILSRKQCGFDDQRFVRHVAEGGSYWILTGIGGLLAVELLEQPAWSVLRWLEPTFRIASLESISFLYELVDSEGMPSSFKTIAMKDFIRHPYAFSEMVKNGRQPLMLPPRRTIRFNGKGSCVQGVIEGDGSASNLPIAREWDEEISWLISEVLEDLEDCPSFGDVSDQAA